MRSIGARLTLWYAVSATVSLAILSFLGSHLLQARLIHGLDELNAAEFRQLRAHIGQDYATVDPKVLESRLENVNQYESVLFYISIDNPERSATIFRTENLQGRPIPDIKGKRTFSASSEALGPLRVSEFLLPPYDVTVATTSRSMNESMHNYLIVSLSLIIIMLLVSIAVGVGLTRLVLRPIRMIRDTATRIGSHNLAERIPISDVDDEMSELAHLLNQTFDRLERAFTQMRRFSEEVSHELKTPLSLVRLHAERILQDEDSPADHREAALEQVEEIARLTSFIDQMLFLSRAEAKAIAFDLDPVDPHCFIEAFSHDASALADHSNRSFNLVEDGRGIVAIEQSWFRQVLFNLTTNALQATPPGGAIQLASSFDQRTWRIVMEDSGPGVEESQLSVIFDRFERLGAGKAGARGAGLGLAISRSIVDLHGGRIWARRSSSLGGLAMVIEIPCIAPTRQGRSPKDGQTTRCDTQ